MQSSNIAISDLVKRLESLEGERNILQTLLYRYGHCIDYGLEQEWIGLFTEDGVFDIRRRHGGDNRRYEGRKALADFIAGHSRAPKKYHKHLLIEPIITLISKKSAAVESYFVRVDEIEGKPCIYAFGRYRDQLLKHGGRWLFKERIVEVEAVVT